VLIAQDQPRIERYLRQQDQQWVLTETSGLTETVQLASIECRLALAEVYDRVRFPDEAEAGAEA
jgi:hypothetical protein